MVYRGTVYKSAFVLRGQLPNRVLELEVKQHTAARNALLICWHNLKVFAVPLAERGKHYASVGKTRREWKSQPKSYVQTPPVVSYYTRAVLRGGGAVAVVLRIAETDFVVSTFTCFVRCAQFGTPVSFMSVQARLIRHRQECYCGWPARCER